MRCWVLYGVRRKEGKEARGDQNAIARKDFRCNPYSRSSVCSTAAKRKQLCFRLRIELLLQSRLIGVVGRIPVLVVLGWCWCCGLRMGGAGTPRLRPFPRFFNIVTTTP